jgi:GTP-binding protein HflX
VARALTELAAETKRVVGVLADRKGEVSHVVLGDAQRVYLPDIGRLRAGKGRLRGLRLCVAKPPTRGGFEVGQDLVTDLEKLQLDLVCVVEAKGDGLPGKAVVLTLLPEAQLDERGDLVRHRAEPFRQIQDVTDDATQLVAELEAELSRKVERARDAAALPGERDTAVVVGAYTTSKREWGPSLSELKELCRTAGVRVVDTVVQRRKKLDPRTVVGKGKLEEICLAALHRGCDLIIFDIDLSPSQLNAITDLTDLRVLDRTMLILDIFARRAVSRGGKLQVELAQLKYSLPRLQKKQEGMSRLTGGIGGQGPGETKLEVDRRRVKERIARLEKDLKRYATQRELRRKRRARREVPTIAIVGYTNAGKSTLLNALTGAEVLAENALFATLDTTSRRLRFPEEREVVLIDTVGFIRDLPATLVNAFRATLEELGDADLLLHVVDAADPMRDKHIEAVEKVIEDLGYQSTPRLLALNKCDEMDAEAAFSLAERKGGVAVSALTRDGFPGLVNRLAELLWAGDMLGSPEVWAAEAVDVDAA